MFRGVTCGSTCMKDGRGKVLVLPCTTFGICGPIYNTHNHTVEHLSPLGMCTHMRHSYPSSCTSAVFRACGPTLNYSSQLGLPTPPLVTCGPLQGMFTLPALRHVDPHAGVLRYVPRWLGVLNLGPHAPKVLLVPQHATLMILLVPQHTT